MNQYPRNGKKEKRELTKKLGTNTYGKFVQESCKVGSRVIEIIRKYSLRSLHLG